jgi:hypothetical protein
MNSDVLPSYNTTTIKTDNEYYDPLLERKLCRLYWCGLICMLVLSSPFIIADLYFAYNDISCQNIIIPNFNFTIGLWLKIDGYILLVWSIIVFYIQINHLIINKRFIILNYIVKLFCSIWTIIGAVMFWKYLEPVNICNTVFSNYLWARLVLGLALTPFLLKFKS